MRCPKCDYLPYNPAGACPHCQFGGDSTQIEELAHLKWMVTEIDAWSAAEIGPPYRQRLREKYLARQRELEVSLGLRLPPFSAEEARQAWPEFFQRQTLLQKMGEWLAEGHIKPESTLKMVEQAHQQVNELQQQLEGHAPPPYPQTDTDRLDVVNFLLQAVDYLRQNQSFVTPAAETEVCSRLLAEKENLEIKLGLRQPRAPTPVPAPVSQPQAETAGQQPVVAAAPPVAPTPKPVPARPAVPFSERLWQTLLSERTLHALLFLGIFLLFAAAISFVVWGWRDFSAPVRVAIPVIFTSLFFTLGWYVRAKTPLYRSGLALSAIAALLVPIDFYTIYVSFDLSNWPLFWLITSVFCLIVYFITALSSRSRIFGYLVGVAAGSTTLALIQMGNQEFGLSTDWRTAGLTITALGLLILATTFRRRGQFHFFAVSFRYLALLTVGVIMPLTFGWRYLNRHTYDTLHYALTINWWVGGFIFAWGALHYRSRSLGLLAAIAIPFATYFTQAAIFNQAEINLAWHGFGLALLTPFYFIAGYKWLARRDDPIIYGHGRTATTGGIILLVVAALWSLTNLTNGTAAAASHTVLALTMVMAALLWRRPGYLYAASLLSLSAVTFTMSEANLTSTQYSVGWASLAIAHIILALSLGSRFPAPMPNYAGALVTAGYIIAALALLPPFFPYDGKILAYALGNWLGLSAWGIRLAHTGQPGFAAYRVGRKTIFHWFTVLPLPFWVWLIFANTRALDYTLPLALAALSWAMVLLSYRLERVNPTYRLPWYWWGGLVSIAAPVAAFVLVPNGLTPAITLLSVSLLYFTDAITRRQSFELAMAGLVTAWGYTMFLSWWHLSDGAVSFGLALLIAVYFLAGLWTERRKSVIFTHKFLVPLYVTAHLLTILLLGFIFYQPLAQFFGQPWTDTMRLWNAAAQLVLGVVYGLYAWGTYRERWAHVAAWQGAAGAGLLAFTYSTGQGSSAVKVALLAAAFVLAERGLYWLRQRRVRNRRQAFIRLTWHLYKRPLLVTGWAISVFAIGLALVRNLWLLGGGRVQQSWAWGGLLLITSLYALSARLFRRARFMWLAALLVFAPWTILTNLGWYTPYHPTLPGFAISWVILAWILYLTGWGLSRRVSWAYALPLKVTAHLLIPWSLLWGIADVDTSCFTFGLAIGLYGLAAFLEHRRLLKAEGRVSVWQSRFLYPAIGLLPVWCVYLLAWLLPAARHEHYGLMLLVFGLLGLAVGQWLKRVAPRPEIIHSYSLPGYLTGYGALIVGTLLVAHEPSLRALALLFDALVLLVSARLFKNPLWVYLAAAIAPLSLLSALSATGAPGNRYGWWLIGLASIYLMLTWTLRRLKLSAYASATLAIGLALIALGLPPSSQDKTGALYGYGSAALLYAITAFWLRQPVLLLPACALVVVPYAIGLQKSPLHGDYYGLALLPGAVIALGLGGLLDYSFGAWRDFPWENPARWPSALAKRWLNWWGLSLYMLGFGLAVSSPFFTGWAALVALNFALLMPIFGWAIYYFRRRPWLLALALAGHLAVIYYLEAGGWWAYPTQACLRFLPLTLIMAGWALFIEQYNREGSPLSSRMWSGWSRPLYLLLLLDITIVQMFCFRANWDAITISLAHTLLMVVFASFWLSSGVAYAGLILGIVVLRQWFFIADRQFERFLLVLAELILGYGLVGYGLSFLRQKMGSERALRPWVAVWELPLRRFSIIASLVVLILTAPFDLEVLVWTSRAIFRLPYQNLINLDKVQTVIGVLALFGLLYLAVAFTQRRPRLGYAATGMLLAGWGLHVFYVQQWDNLQWYALPTGLYLLGMAYLEWRRGNKVLARWLDYLAMALLMGTLFWQTLLFGWTYSLSLLAEGMLTFWLGSARRLRRFLYGGVMGVALATIGQLTNSWSSVNQWIVFGGIGLLVIVTAIVVERKLEDIKAWQESEIWE